MTIETHADFDEENAANVLNQLPIGVLCRDVEGRVLWFNEELQALFPKMATPAAIGLTINEVSPTENEYGEHHQRAVESGEITQRSTMGDHFAAGKPHLLRTVIPLSSDRGEIWGSATLVEDRSEMFALEQQLVQAQKLESVGQLAAGIAHEINTPMQYIGDNTHFLKNTVTRLIAVAEAAQTTLGPDATSADRDRLAELLEKSKLPLLATRAPKAADDALSGVATVSRIVTAMKRFSHPGSADMAPVDLNDSIATTMTVCRNEWRYAAEITTNFGPLPPVEAHLGELNQVWLNMIVNAAHAVSERHGDAKGCISVTTAHDETTDTVIVTIADDGAGISQENITRVLDPFFTTKPVGQGTGQGLTIAHQVITQDHHGTMVISSIRDAGTTFTITLPVTQPAKESS